MCPVFVCGVARGVVGDGAHTLAVTVEGCLLTFLLVLLVLLNGSVNALFSGISASSHSHTPPPHSPSPITPGHHSSLLPLPSHPSLITPPFPMSIPFPHSLIHSLPPSPSFPPLTSTQQQSRSLKPCTRRPLTLRRRLGGPPPLPREDPARCGSQTHRQHTVRQSKKGVDNEGEHLSSVLPPSPPHLVSGALLRWSPCQL